MFSYVSALDPHMVQQQINQISDDGPSHIPRHVIEEF